MTTTTESDAHSSANGSGAQEARDQARKIRRYLDALDSANQRGRRRSPEVLVSKLKAIEAAIPEADIVKRLSLVQQRLDLEAELATLDNDNSVDLHTVEADFIGVAAAYALRKGISYGAFREVGVPVAVLRASGLVRSA